MQKGPAHQGKHHSLERWLPGCVKKWAKHDPEAASKQCFSTAFALSSLSVSFPDFRQWWSVTCKLKSTFSFSKLFLVSTKMKLEHLGYSLKESQVLAAHWENSIAGYRIPRLSLHISRPLSRIPWLLLPATKESKAKWMHIRRGSMKSLIFCPGWVRTTLWQADPEKSPVRSGKRSSLPVFVWDSGPG